MAKKITKISKGNVKIIGQEVEDAIQKIAAKYGLECKRGNIRYSDSDLKFTGLRIVVPGETGGDPKKEEDFKFYAVRAGFKADDLGRVFVAHDGDELKIVGWNTRAQKNKVELISTKDGSKYHAPASYVQSFLKG